MWCGEACPSWIHSRERFTEALETKQDFGSNMRRKHFFILPFCLFLFGISAQSAVRSEKDLPAGTFEHLTAAQKKVALQVLNTASCNCGCKLGTIAECRIHDEKCPVSKKLLARIVTLAAEEKNLQQILQQLQTPPADTSTSKVLPVTMVPYRTDDPFYGSVFAKVTIVEFSEFQCPFCSRVVPVVKQILEAYPNDVKLVFKHLPLSFHENAMAAAKAAEAAREQGKFWEMHDILFLHQKNLLPGNFSQWAGQIGLDQARFQSSMLKSSSEIRIQQDLKLGEAVGATATPTFFINGRILIGSKPLETFRKMIDAELLKADELLRRGQELNASFYPAIVAENKRTQTVSK